MKITCFISLFIKEAGYSTEMKEDSVRRYQFPQGEVWQKLLSDQNAEINLNTGSSQAED